MILVIRLTCTNLQTYSGAQLAEGVQGIQTPALFWTVQIVPSIKFLNQFRRNALKNQFKKRKNLSKQCTSNILLKFFNATLRRAYTNESGIRECVCGPKECVINF